MFNTHLEQRLLAPNLPATRPRDTIAWPPYPVGTPTPYMVFTLLYGFTDAWTMRPAMVLNMRLLGNTTGEKTRLPGNGGLWPSDHAALAARLRFD